MLTISTIRGVVHSSPSKQPSMAPKCSLILTWSNLAAQLPRMVSGERMGRSSVIAYTFTKATSQHPGLTRGYFLFLPGFFFLKSHLAKAFFLNTALARFSAPSASL